MLQEDDFLRSVEDFCAAQHYAEKTGEHSFVCPLCGGEAWWGRSTYNNHLHCGCKKCGFTMME